MSLMAARQHSVLRHQRQSFSGSADNLAAIANGHPTLSPSLSKPAPSPTSTTAPTPAPVPEPGPGSGSAPEPKAGATAQKQPEADLIHWGTDDKSSDLLNEPDIQRALMNFSSSSSSTSPSPANANPPAAVIYPQVAAPKRPPAPQIAPAAARVDVPQVSTGLPPPRAPPRPPRPPVPQLLPDSPSVPQSPQDIIAPSTSTSSSTPTISAATTQPAPSQRPARPPPPFTVTQEPTAASSPPTRRPDSLLGGAQSRWPPSDPMPSDPMPPIQGSSPTRSTCFPTLSQSTTTTRIFPIGTVESASQPKDEAHQSVSSLVSRFSVNPAGTAPTAQSPLGTRNGTATRSTMFGTTTRAPMFPDSPQHVVGAPRGYPVKPSGEVAAAVRSTNATGGGASESAGDLLDFGPQTTDSAGGQPEWAEFDPLIGSPVSERKKTAPIVSPRPFSAVPVPTQRLPGPGVSSLVIQPAAIRTPLLYQQQMLPRAPVPAHVTYSGLAPQQGLAALGAAGGLRFGPMRSVPFSPGLMQMQMQMQQVGAVPPPGPNAAGLQTRAATAMQSIRQPSSNSLDPFGD